MTLLRTTLLYSFTTAIMIAAVWFPLQIDAATIGLSPSSIIATVAPDTVESFAFTLLRTDTTADQEYSIRLDSAASFIEMQENSVLMPEGVAESAVEFLVNTTDLPMGTYTEVVEFIPENSYKDASGIDVELSLAGSVQITVAHPQQDTTNIQVSSLNSVSQVLSISEQTYNPPSIATGSHEETIFEWVLKNTADLPIIDIPYQIILYKNDQPIRIDNGLYTNPILQGEPAAISMKADISAAGHYDVIFAVADLSTSSSFTVRSMNALVYVPLSVLFSILVLIGVGGALYVRSTRA